MQRCSVSFRFKTVVPMLVFCAMALPGVAALAGEVEQRAVDIWSDGTRLSGDVFSPKDRDEGELLPAIVLCHGWGGVKSHLNPTYAPQFAAAGCVVLPFACRGRGQRDTLRVIDGDEPPPEVGGAGPGGP